MASTEAVFQGYTWMVLFLDISSRINFTGRFEMKGYFSSSFRSDYATSRYVRFIRATSFFFFFFSIDGQTIVKERKSEISRSVRTTNKLPVNSNRRGSWMLIARPSWTIWDGRRDVCLLNLYKWCTVHGPLTPPVPPHPSKSRKPGIHFSFPRGIPGCLSPPPVSPVSCAYISTKIIPLGVPHYYIPRAEIFNHSRPLPFVTRSFHHVSILLPFLATRGQGYPPAFLKGPALNEGNQKPISILERSILTLCCNV